MPPEQMLAISSTEAFPKKKRAKPERAVSSDRAIEHANYVMLALEEESLQQAKTEVSEVVLKDEQLIDEDENIDYRGAEKQIEQTLGSIVQALEADEITEAESEMILEEVAKKSIKDALELAVKTSYDPQKMLEVLGRTAALMHPEDPEYQDDEILARLRWRAQFDDSEAKIFKDAQIIPPELHPGKEQMSEKGKTLLAKINTDYSAFAKEQESRGRKKNDAISRYEVPGMMTREEFDAYRTLKDIEPILEGVMSAKKVRELAQTLPIPKEVMSELEGMRMRQDLDPALEITDLPKTFEYITSFAEKLPLYPEYKKASDAGESFIDHEWSKQTDPLNDAFGALVGSFEKDQLLPLEKVQTMLRFFGTEEKEIEEIIRQKREKLDALMPHLLKGKANRLDVVRKELQEKADEHSDFKEDIEARVKSIVSMQESLRQLKPLKEDEDYFSSYGPYEGLQHRFSLQSAKEAQKINFPEGFNEGLTQADGTFPGFTFVAKHDVYTEQQSARYSKYLFPNDAQYKWDRQSENGGRSKADQDSADEMNETYEQVQENSMDHFFESRDEEENIDGDPKKEYKQKLLELSRPVHTMMLQGVYDSYDEKTHKWKITQPIPEPSVDRKQNLVVAKIPVRSGIMRLPVPMYGTVNVDRVVGVGPDSQPIPVVCSRDDKGFIQVEISAESEVKQVMYEMTIPEKSPELTPVSRSEYRLWRTMQGERGQADEAEEMLKKLPAECKIFLKKIAEKSPAEQVAEIEKFVRSVGFYDFDNGQTFSQKRGKNIAERLEIMRARLNDLREEYPQLLENKIFAGVCADFQELTTAMFQASGLRAGRIAGLRVSGESATAANSHALSYVEWPDENGERQIIPVDGTPSSAITPEEKAILKRLQLQSLAKKQKQAEQQKTEKKQQTSGAQESEETEVSEKEDQQTITLKMEQAIAEQAEKNFAEYLDETLTPQEKQRIQSLRNSLMYSGLKKLDSTYLRGRKQAKEIALLFGPETSGPSGEDWKGIDMIRTWKNLVKDWSGSDGASLRRDLEYVVHLLKGSMTKKENDVIEELLRR